MIGKSSRHLAVSEKVHGNARFILLIMLVTMVFPALAQSEPSTEDRLTVAGGEIYYKIVGAGLGTPLLLVHGGPGVGSRYLSPFAALADEWPVIFYDQLGGGRSDRPNDDALWTIKRSVDELNALIEALPFERVVLLGHSWGGTLIFEFSMTHPDTAAALIFASPLLDSRLMEADIDRQVAAMSAHHQEVLRPLANPKDDTTNAYGEAVWQYHLRHTARVKPWPDILRFSEDYPMGRAVYEKMIGKKADSFVLTGTLKNYSAIGRLRHVTAPTYFISGEHDYASPAALRYFSSFVPGSTVREIPQASHMWFIEQPEDSMLEVREILGGVDDLFRDQ